MKYEHTFKGLITDLYKTHTQRSKIHNFGVVQYSKEELKNWIVNQDNFEKLFKDWVESEFKTALKPSVDRISDYGPYSIDNIQLMTWNENFEKSLKDKINRVTKKQLRPVSKFDLDGNHICNYESIVDASKDNNLHATHIGRCCRNVIKTSGGFIWKYM